MSDTSLRDTAPLLGVATPQPRTPAPRRAWRATALLPVLGIALPLLLLGAGALQSWQAAWRETEMELAGSADAAAEFTSRVLSAHAVGAGRLNEILRGLDDAAIRARETELHVALRAAVAEIPHANAAFVLDRTGTPLVAADVHPVPRWPVSVDREFFLALQAPAAPAVHVSPVFASRVNGERFFVVSRRRAGTGNAEAADGGIFDGVVGIALYPEALGPDLRRMRRGDADVLAVLREDGQFLAGTGRHAFTATAVPPASPFHAIAASGAAEARYRSVDPVRGEKLLVAARAVPGFPLWVTATRPSAAVLAAWQERLLPQLAVGLPAMLALLALALAVRRGQHRLEEANSQLEQRVADRTAALSELSGALDLTPAMVLDLDGRIRHWSIGCERTYGYTAAEAEGRRASELLRTEWPGGSDAVLRAGLRQHGEWRGEVRQRRRDGTMVVAAAHWILRRDPVTGRPTGLVSTRADLTAQRSAEEALHATERRLRQAQEASGVIPFGIEADGALHGSESLRALFGWDADAPLDLAALAARVVPEDRAALAAAVARLAHEGGVFAFDVRIQAPGRGQRWVHLRGEAEPDPAGGDRPRSVLGVALDITERRLAERALAESEERLRLAQEAAGLGIFDYDLVTGELAWDPRLRALWSVPEGMPVTPRVFRAALHPEDAAARRAALRRALRPGGDGTLRAEYRVIGIADGIERWVAVSGRIRRVPGTARAVRLLGAAFDVTARKQAELRNELLMREVDHRAKNALAVVQAALRLSRAETPAELVRIVEGRVAALARAQTVLAQRQWQGAELRTLLEGELAPFLPRGAAAAPRVTLDGPPVTIGAYAAQPICMALHELATNATKYGALSRAGGTVAVRWDLAGGGAWLRLEWQERGGPALAGAPERRGFGSRVIEQTITQQLGGRIDRSWPAAGLRCVMELPLRRGAELTARAA